LKKKYSSAKDQKKRRKKRGGGRVSLRGEKVRAGEGRQKGFGNGQKGWGKMPVSSIEKKEEGSQLERKNVRFRGKKGKEGPGRKEKMENDRTQASLQRIGPTGKI